MNCVLFVETKNLKVMNDAIENKIDIEIGLFN